MSFWEPLLPFGSQGRASLCWRASSNALFPSMQAGTAFVITSHQHQAGVTEPSCTAGLVGTVCQACRAVAGCREGHGRAGCPHGPCLRCSVWGRGGSHVQTPLCRACSHWIRRNSCELQYCFVHWGEVHTAHLMQLCDTHRRRDWSFQHQMRIVCNCMQQLSCATSWCVVK